MSNTTEALRCPNCGAGLSFDPEKQNFHCEFCLSDFTEPELREAGAFDDADNAVKKDEEFCGHMSEYHCPNCGADMAVDENTAADFCLFCHNPVVLTGKLSGQKHPDKVIPFAFDRDEAKKRFLGWAKKKVFCPSDFFSDKHADMIRGIYYPFWVTDADADTKYETTAHRVRAWIVGKVKYVETSDFKVERTGDIHFEDIVTSAITDADKQMLEGVLPYPSDSLIDFSMPYLSGFAAKKRNIERETLTPEVQGRMNDYAAQLMKNTVEGYTSVDRGKANVKVKKSHWYYTLMPVWILTYKKKGKKKDKTYTFAMNGHTGKIYGELPVSIPKLLLCGAAVGLAAALLAFLLGVAICV